MLKIHVAVWHNTYFCVPLTQLKPGNSDAIKAIVHTVNIKLRKLNKNKVINTDKS